MRIACCVGRYPCGSEAFIRREVEALAARGHELAIWPCEGRGAGWLRPEGTAIAEGPRAPAARWDRTAGALGRCGALQLRRLPAILRAARCLPWQPDLVLAHFAGLPALMGAALASGLGRPLAISVHARDVWVPWAPGLRALTSARAILGCNRASLDRLREIRPDLAPRTHLVHHGVSVCPGPAAERDQFKIQNSKPKIIFSAGRFVPKKGFSVLVDALALVRRQRPDAQLRIAGDGPEREALQAAAKGDKSPSPLAGEGRGEGKVSFLGWLDEMQIREQLQRAALVVVPSVVALDGDRDGIPNLLLEAMVAGVPVIGTRVGGIPEVILDDPTQPADATGWLVPPGDAEALARAILAVLHSPDDAAVRAARGRDLVRRQFDSSANAATLEQVLLEATSLREGGSPYPPAMA